MICIGLDPQNTINQTHSVEHWLKVFSKFKDFLLVSICDEELVNEALVILHNFLTSPAMKFTIYEECRESLLKSIELLYDGNSQICKDAFRKYLL
jgi:hypothetical protein